MTRVGCELAAASIAAVLLFSGPAAAQRSSQRGGGKMTIPVQKSGKVVMKDGTPLPETVVIEASCGGTYRPVARSDSKGGFIIGRGRESDVDARVRSGSDPTQLPAGCTLQARLPGYLSSTLAITDAEKFDLGTIELSRPAGIEGTLTSATSLSAPKPAQKAFDKAKSPLEKQKWAEARPNLEKAVELYPEYAAAWFELGRVHQASGDAAQARTAFERAIKADPKFVKPYLQLAGILHKQQDWKGAAELTATMVKLDPYSFPAAYVLNAISNLRLGNLSAAEDSAAKAVKLDTDHLFPEAEYTLGLLMADRGEAKGAIEHLKKFLEIAPNSPGAEKVRAIIADLAKQK